MFTSHSHRNVCSYPRPTSSSPFPSPAVAPEPFIPLQPPPSATPPSLPRRPSLPPLPVGWKRTQHALHAAYPRTFEASTGTLSRECNPFDANPLEGETKDDRKERAEKAGRTVLKRRVAAGTSARADDGAKDQHGLWIAAEKWQRTNTEGDDGLTLVMTHANGFTKESWHPTLTRLINLGSASPGATFGDPMTDPSLPKLRISDSHNYNVSANAGQIDTVWLLDDVHHGASIDLNAGKLGPIHNWSDGGRDVISAIEQVMSKDWARNGKVIGVGHSVGGNALVQAAHARPDLFHSLFLVEPMCPPFVWPKDFPDLPPTSWPLVYGAMKRRTTWSSRQAALEYIKASPFFVHWHPEVMDLWASHALVPIPNDSFTTNTPSTHSPNSRSEVTDLSVQLATPSWAEACVFAEPTGLATAWDKLPHLTMPIGFIMGRHPISTMVNPDPTRELVWRPPLAANEIIKSAGHLVVQEKPDELADALWRYISVVGNGDTKAKL